MSSRAIVDELARIVRNDHVVDDPTLLAAAAVDGITPRWLIRASTIEQVSAILSLAWQESLAVVPRGSGSALASGRPSDRVDLVLDLTGLNRVVEDNPDDLTASVEAGLTAGALAARLAPRRQWLPVDPPAVAGRTLGGLAATNAHGPLRARYGTLRDFLLGVRFVQPDGVVTWGGARVVKSVTGYDVPKLMVGSLGTLGILCELTLRLHPRPEAEGTRISTFDSTEAAAAFVARVLDSSLEPNRVEFVNGAALGRLDMNGHAPAAIAISVGSVEDAVRDQLATIEALARTAGGKAEPASSSFWEAYATMRSDAGRVLALHVSTPPSRLAATVSAVERALTDLVPGERAVIAGCAALGTLDVLLPETAVPMAVPLVERLRGAVAELAGHVIVSRAPLAVRRAVDPWGPVEPGPLALMRALRDEFDPKRVLNPGRFIV
ncbi:MAG TPA: FAD-binding oxidoreductase [Candidatus Acidoferrum sp.]|nr:FAD-binding oxidoreductase [Candidatus Acidoferrum sp.]